VEAFLKLKLVGIMTSDFVTAFIEKAIACNLGISLSGPMPRITSSTF